MPDSTHRGNPSVDLHRQVDVALSSYCGQHTIEGKRKRGRRRLLETAQDSCLDEENPFPGQTSSSFISRDAKHGVDRG